MQHVTRALSTVPDLTKHSEALKHVAAYFQDHTQHEAAVLNMAVHPGVLASEDPPMYLAILCARQLQELEHRLGAMPKPSFVSDECLN